MREIPNDSPERTQANPGPKVEADRKGASSLTKQVQPPGESPKGSGLRGASRRVKGGL